MEETIFSVGEVDGTFCRAGLYDVSAFSSKSPSSLESKYYIWFPNGHYSWIMRFVSRLSASDATDQRDASVIDEFKVRFQSPYKQLQCNMTTTLLKKVPPGAYVHRGTVTATLDWLKIPWERNKLSSQSSQPLKCFGFGFYLLDQGDLGFTRGSQGYAITQSIMVWKWIPNFVTFSYVGQSTISAKGGR